MILQLNDLLLASSRPLPHLTPATAALRHPSSHVGSPHLLPLVHPGRIHRHGAVPTTCSPVIDFGTGSERVTDVGQFVLGVFYDLLPLPQRMRTIHAPRLRLLEQIQRIPHRRAVTNAVRGLITKQEILGAPPRGVAGSDLLGAGLGLGLAVDVGANWPLLLGGLNPRIHMHL